MGSPAVSRLAIDEALPSASIADQVAVIARKELAPQALAIDRLEVYLGGLALSPTLRSGGGDLVVILGRGFDAATTVDIDGHSAPVLFWTDTALSVGAPQVAPGKGPVSVLLRVRNAGGCTGELITIADPRHRAAGH